VIARHSVGDLAEISQGGVKRIVIGDVEIVVVRIGDKVYAIGDRCSHANVSLSEGEVDCETKEIECVKHGSRFSLETGIPSSLPATQPVPVYIAQVEDGKVFVTIDDGAAK